MGVKYKSETNALPELSETLSTIGGRKVVIGALKGKHAWLASIHEYGCNIPVTDKMRAWLHYQGVHLKSNTTAIRIPERSFLRSTFDNDGDKILKQTDRLLSLVVDGKLSVDDMLDACGEQFASKIKVNMGKTKPNAPLTIEWKGSSTPLTDGGGLVDSITWEKSR